MRDIEWHRETLRGTGSDCVCVGDGVTSAAHVKGTHRRHPTLQNRRSAPPAWERTKLPSITFVMTRRSRGSKSTSKVTARLNSVVTLGEPSSFTVKACRSKLHLTMQSSLLLPLHICYWLPFLLMTKSTGTGSFDLVRNMTSKRKRTRWSLRRKVCGNSNSETLTSS